MTYNTEKEQNKGTNDVPVREDGTVGIRATLNKMGFANNRIGYSEKEGAVTLDNRALIKPAYLDDAAGVSYAAEKDIQKSLVDYYQSSNNPIVRVSDAYASAAGKAGLSADALTYGNGTVSIGGTPLDILYVDGDGKSWTWQNNVEDAVRNYLDSTDVQDPLSLAETYRRRYLTDASNLLENLQNREAFSYNPDEDPVYQAYKNKYMLEGERASRDAMATYSSLTGGYANSAAATAAAQAELYYARYLTDAIPTLAQQAYERYNQQYQNDLSLVKSMVDFYDTAYQNAVDANTAQRNNVNLSAASNVARDQASWEQNWEEAFNEQEYAENQWDVYLKEQSAEKNTLVNEGLKLDNLQKEIYQKYYEQLLQEELKGGKLSNQLTQAKIYQAYQ